MPNRAGPTTVFTIGHSTRTLEEFEALLAREEIRRLVDIRSYPGSRRYPHFDRETLRAALERRGVSYHHVPALGGRRTPTPGSPPSPWRNAAFRGYAEHMKTSEFRHALLDLLEFARSRPTAMMCSEALPWRCHRLLASDAVVARGARVVHILDASSEEHTLTRFASVVDGDVSYGGDAGAAAGAT